MLSAVGGQEAIGSAPGSCLGDDCICKELGSVTNPRSGVFATLAPAIKERAEWGRASFAL